MEEVKVSEELKDERTREEELEERVSELEAIVDGLIDYLEEVEVEEEIIVEPSPPPESPPESPPNSIKTGQNKEETATTVMSSGRGETEKVEESTLERKDENSSEKTIKQGKRQPRIWG